MITKPAAASAEAHKQLQVQPGRRIARHRLAAHWPGRPSQGGADEHDAFCLSHDVHASAMHA